MKKLVKSPEEHPRIYADLFQWKEKQMPSLES